MPRPAAPDLDGLRVGIGWLAGDDGVAREMEAVGRARGREDVMVEFEMEAVGHRYFIFVMTRLGMARMSINLPFTFRLVLIASTSFD